MAVMLIELAGTPSAVSASAKRRALASPSASFPSPSPTTRRFCPFTLLANFTNGPASEPGSNAEPGANANLTAGPGGGDLYIAARYAIGCEGIGQAPGAGDTKP